MKIRECLKELAEKFNLPNEEYRELISYRDLASNKKLLEKLLREKSPEAIKVACLSGRGYEVALKDIQNLYMGEEKSAIEGLIKKYSFVDDFEKDILSRVDINIINKFADYFLILEQEKCELQDQQQNPDKEPSDIDEISNQIALIDKCTVPYKAHKKAIRQWQTKEESEDGFKTRHENLMNIYQNTPELVVTDFFSSGKANEELKKLISDKESFKKILEELHRRVGYEIEILWELWRQKLINCKNKDILVYLQQHSQQANDFLKKRMQSDKVDIEDSFLELLLQVLIEKERENLATGEVNRNIDIWNEFIDEEQWQCILSKMRKVISSDEIPQMLSSILRKLEGCSVRALVEVLCESYTKENNISLWEIANNISYNDFGQNKEIILRFMQCIEKSNTVKGKKIAAFERRLQGQAKEVYANVYEPEEKLEELVTNLATFSGEIAPNTVRQQLLPIVKDFRKGFERLGVNVLTGGTKWENNESVRFNPEKHTMPSNGRPHKGDDVKLNTLGFFYKDEEGNPKKHLAKIYWENKVEKKNNSQKSGKQQCSNANNIGKGKKSAKSK